MKKLTKLIEDNFKDYFLITMGTFFVVVALYFFLDPQNIAAGGVYGLGMIVRHCFDGITLLKDIPLGAITLVMNIVLLIIGLLVVGAGFSAKTIFSIAVYSGFTIIFELIQPHPQALAPKDPLLILFIGILIQGLGMAIVFNANASTGGTDIIAKIINKFTHLDIGKALLLTDLIVTVMFGLVLKSAEAGLYSSFSVVLNGLLIDKAIESLNAHKEIRIISSKNLIIKDYIINTLDRGATFYYGEGAYSSNKVEILSTIVTRKEFIKLKYFIKDTDQDAFIKVYDVYETFGEGFASITE